MRVYQICSEPVKKSVCCTKYCFQKQKKLDHPDHSLRSGRHWIILFVRQYQKLGDTIENERFTYVSEIKNQLVNNIEMKKICRLQHCLFIEAELNL